MEAEKKNLAAGRLQNTCLGGPEPATDASQQFYGPEAQLTTRGFTGANP